MKTITLKNVLIFLLSRYFIFYIVLAFLDRRFQKIVLENSTSQSEVIENSLRYIAYGLFQTVLLALLLLFPYYLVLKIRNILQLSLALLVLLITEYRFYTYFYSPSDSKNGVINIVICLALLILFYYRNIINRLKKLQDH